MDRHQLVDATYATGKRLNRIKAEYGLIPTRQAEATEQRIEWAMTLLAEIDELMATASPERLRAGDGAVAARDRAGEHVHSVRQTGVERRHDRARG